MRTLEERLAIHAKARRLLKEWDESDHPRDEDGKWTDAGGGEGGGSDESGGASSANFSDKEKEDLHVFGAAHWGSGKGGKADYDKLRSSKSFGETLNKLPRVTRTVYRGMVISQKEVGQFKANSEITIQKHSFASPNRQYATAFAQLQLSRTKGATPIVLTIKDANGVNYGQSGYSAGKNKLEIVLTMGAKIKVTSVRETEINGRKGYHVTSEYMK